MSVAALFVLAFCVPAHGQLSLGEAYSAARILAAESGRYLSDSQSRADDAEFKEWGIDTRFLSLRRRSRDCAGAECAAMRRKLADALRAVPPFLRSGRLETVYWNDPVEAGEIDGHADGKMVSVTAPPDQLLRVLLHELAHHHDEHGGEASDAYIHIRFFRQPLRDELDALWRHIGGNEDAVRPRIDGHVRSELRRLRVLRRNDDDVHLIEDRSEYWAGSVEFYYACRGERAALLPYLSEEEIGCLEKLFKQPR